MAGGEDSSPHTGEKATTPTPAPSSAAPAKTKDILPLETTGQIMIGISLLIILLVITCCIVHLIRKQRRQQYPNGKPKRRKNNTKLPKDLEKGTVELHSVDKQVFEVGGSVLYELPADAHPRQELDAGMEEMMLRDLTTPMERSMTGTTRVTDATDEIQPASPAVVSPMEAWPTRALAMYWQAH